MSEKWIVIGVIGVFGVMFAPIAFMEYSKSVCRIEAIKAHMEADAIAKVCGK